MQQPWRHLAFTLYFFHSVTKHLVDDFLSLTEMLWHPSQSWFLLQVLPSCWAFPKSTRSPVISLPNQPVDTSQLLFYLASHSCTWHLTIFPAFLKCSVSLVSISMHSALYSLLSKHCSLVLFSLSSLSILI